MNIVADMLTALRGVFVLIILYTGLLRRPDEGLASVALLTSLAWITDVLDGPLARRARRPTRLGRCDLAADIGLTFRLSPSSRSSSRSLRGSGRGSRRSPPRPPTARLSSRRSLLRKPEPGEFAFRGGLVYNTARGPRRPSGGSTC